MSGWAGKAKSRDANGAVIGTTKYPAGPQKLTRVQTDPALLASVIHAADVNFLSRSGEIS